MEMVYACKILLDTLMAHFIHWLIYVVIWKKGAWIALYLELFVVVNRAA